MTSRPRTRIPSRPRLEFDRLVSRAKVIVNQPAPEVGTVSVTSPARVLDLVDYSSSASDPSKDSLPPAPELPLVSPFLCSDDSEADNESESAEHRLERHESLTVHDAMISRWRDRVASRPSLPSGSSSHDTLAPSSEFPVALVVAPPEILGPFPARRLSWRRVSHRLSDRHFSPDFTLDSSSSGSSSDSSLDTFSGSPSDSLSDTSSVHSSGCDASGPTHSVPSTRVASSRSTPLSTPYPLTTSQSSLDSSSERSLDLSSLFAGPSRKRCRSPTTSISLSTPVSRLIAPTHVDLLPPRKRFRYSYSPEYSREEHIEIGTADAETVTDLGIGDGVNNEDGIGMGVEIVASDIREDEKEFEAEASAGGTMEMAIDPLVTGGISESTRGDAHDLEGTLYDIVHYMSEVPLDRITEFETAQRQLEAGQLMASGERAGLTDRIKRLKRENLRVQALLCIERDQDMTITRSRMTPEAIKELIAQRIAEALANYEATHAANALEVESQSQNGNDGDNGNGGNRNGNHGGGGNNGNGNLNKNGRGTMPVAYVCTYQDFVMCQLLSFKGTEGVVGFTRWFEKMEIVVPASNNFQMYQKRSYEVDDGSVLSKERDTKNGNLIVELDCEE
ncbi:hypothetical protein Tco_1532307 [Tanacetum coccineum]